MRLVIDLQACQSPGSRIRGIGRYSLALAQAMVRQAGSHDCLIALNGAIVDSVEPLRAAFADLLPPDRVRSWASTRKLGEAFYGGAARSSVAGELFRQAMREFRPDFVHITSLFEGLDSDVANIVGTRDEGLPTAVTLYDLIPLAQADVYLEPHPPVKSWYMRKIAQLKRAEVLLAISEFSRQEGIGLLGLDAERVVDIRGACDEVFHPVALNEALRMRLHQRYGIDRPFLMYAGGFDSRKNILNLIRAFAALPAIIRQAHQLLIVGSPPANERKAIDALRSELGLDPHDCVMLGYVSDADLAALYSDCRLYAFPSLQEGFGLPALEAMACGAVVVGSNLSSLPEVIGFADALFDPRELADITAALQRGLCDEGFRQAFLTHARGQVRKFTWHESARLSWQALEAAHELARDAHATKAVVPIHYIATSSKQQVASSQLPRLLDKRGASAEELLAHKAPSYYVIGDAVSAATAWQVLRRRTIGVVLDADCDLTRIVRELDEQETGRSQLEAILAEQGAFAVALADGTERLANIERVVREWMSRVAAQVLVLEPKSSVQPDALALFRCGRDQRAGEAVTRMLALPTRPSADDYYWRAVALAANHNCRVAESRSSRMLVDISQLAVHDARTGVQRVVRNLLRCFLHTPPVGTQVLPVYFDDGGNCRHARSFTWRFLGLDEAAARADDAVVDWLPNDHFVGLDLSAHIVPFHLEKFVRLRDLGIQMSFLVHDLLPDTRPDCFDPYVVEVLRRWYRAVAELSTTVACVSRATADDFVNWLDQAKVERARPMRVGHFHNGADPEKGVAERGSVDGEYFAALPERPTVLMVSTIEPRKGYQQALEAFEWLWVQDIEANLAIVGKAGWQTDELIKRLRGHVQLGKQLFWFEGASDELLHALYRRSDLLLSASEGEGFGLPVIEAAKYGIPLLLRDLRVFREVAGQYADYFSGYAPADLGRALADWLVRSARGEVPPDSTRIRSLTWQQSYEQFLEVLEGRRTDYIVGNSERYWFPSADPRMQTQCGVYRRGRLYTNERAGFLIYGPYAKLAVGSYRLRVFGTLYEVDPDGWLDIVSDGANQTHYRGQLAPKRGDAEILLEDRIVLHSPVNALEIRVWTTGRPGLRLDGFELVRLHEDLV